MVLVALPLSGHLVPMLRLADELASRGHRVVVASAGPPPAWWTAARESSTSSAAHEVRYVAVGDAERTYVEDPALHVPAGDARLGAYDQFAELIGAFSSGSQRSMFAKLLDLCTVPGDAPHLLVRLQRARLRCTEFVVDPYVVVPTLWLCNLILVRWWIASPTPASTLRTACSCPT